MYICHVFYGGPHGRIADRLNVLPSKNIVNNDNNNNNNIKKNDNHPEPILNRCSFSKMSNKYQ